MKWIALLIALVPSTAFGQVCIPEPAKLTYGEKGSDDWVTRCERQFRNPLPTCHRLYVKPDDRKLCLGVIVKLDAYDRGRDAAVAKAKPPSVRTK